MSPHWWTIIFQPANAPKIRAVLADQKTEWRLETMIVKRVPAPTCNTQLTLKETSKKTIKAYSPWSTRSSSGQMSMGPTRTPAPGHCSCSRLRATWNTNQKNCSRRIATTSVAFDLEGRSSRHSYREILAEQTASVSARTSILWYTREHRRHEHSSGSFLIASAPKWPNDGAYAGPLVFHCTGRLLFPPVL